MSRPADWNVALVLAGLLSWPNQSMDVLGRHDEHEQTVMMPTDNPVNGFTKPGSPQIVRQKRHPSIAGKRQLMRSPRLFETSDSLSMRWSHGMRAPFSTGMMEG